LGLSVAHFAGLAYFSALYSVFKTAKFRLSDGTILPACSASVALNLKPEPPPRPTPPESHDKPTQTPPPPSTATPVSVNTPAVTTTVFPVVFLPETGTREFKYEDWGFISELLLLVLVSSLVVIYFLGQDNT
jgi:hypothetical protein